MIKDFDKWNKLKQKIDGKQSNKLFHEGEIWWISFGVNIGKEIFGKNKNFERPGLVLKKFSNDTALILPITSTVQQGSFYCNLFLNKKERSILLHQARFVSSKRFLRKIERISDVKLKIVKGKYNKLHQIEIPDFSGISQVTYVKDNVNISDSKNKSNENINMDIFMKEKIIKYINDNYDFGEIIEEINPKQGLSSDVFILKFKNHEDVVVKYGDSADKDIYFLNLIQEKKSDVKVPKLYGNFSLQNMHIILLERIEGKLFGEVEVLNIKKYFLSVIKNLNELHKIKSKNDWKAYLQSIVNNKMINWNDVFCRKNINKDLLKKSLEKISEKINGLTFQENTFSLLHTDFNQSNLFVNENTYEIVGVIDWEEAVFGDPVYDFARFHLHLWHRDVSMEDKKLFFELLDFNEEEKNREEIYFKLFIVHYLAYYSESDNGFSLGRIKMHEEFLKNNL